VDSIQELAVMACRDNVTYQMGSRQCGEEWLCKGEEQSLVVFICQIDAQEPDESLEC
jgi:hypothetical protein